MPVAYLLSTGEGKPAKGKWPLSQMGLEIKMFSQWAETFTSKERRGSPRTFKITDWRLPEPCQGSEGYNTATMMWKTHGNQELPPLSGPPPVLTKISKWYLGHPIFVQHLWEYIFYTYRGKVSNTIHILFLIKREIYSKPILKPFISPSPPLSCLYTVPNNFNSSPTPPNLKLSYFFVLIRHVILRIPIIYQSVNSSVNSLWPSQMLPLHSTNLLKWMI